MLNELAVVDQVASTLATYAVEAEGAYTSATARARRSDTAIFADFCSDRGESSIPAAPSTVAEFVRYAAQDRAPATVARYLSSIAHHHRAAGVADPTKAETVRLAMRAVRRQNTTRQKQAAPLNAPVLDRLAVALKDSVTELRDLALLRVARDALLRRSELVSLDVDDVEPASDGSGTVTIRRSKTDQEGVGAVLYLSPATLEAVERYRAAANIEAGPLWRRIRKGGDVTEERLAAGSVRTIFKKLADKAGLETDGISGHSARVGMAQDLTAAGADLPALMVAGRWKSPAMPARYAERQAARRGAVARFYELAP